MAADKARASEQDDCPSVADGTQAGRFHD
jgi:hypothetical protein